MKKRKALPDCLVLLVFLALWSSDLRAEILGPEVCLNVVGEKSDLTIDNDGDLHLVYYRGYGIYYLRQVNGNWQSERQVPGADSSTFNPRWSPHIGVDSSDNAHFAWSDPFLRYVYYNSFTNNTWTGHQVVISDADGGGDTNRSDLVVDINDNVMVIAQSDWGIDYNRKPSGSDFLGEGTVWRNVGDEPTFPFMGASPVDTGVYAVYAMDSYPDLGLQYNRWTGSTWGSPLRPGPTGGVCCPNYGNVTVDNHGKPHMVWTLWRSDTLEFSDLHYIYQRENGTWSSITALVSQSHFFNCDSDECPEPRVGVADNGTVLVVFADNQATSKTYYMIKDVETGLWGTRKRLTPTASTYSDYPAIAKDGNKFYVVWTDSRNDDSIYMRTIDLEILPDPLNPPVLNQVSAVDGKVFLAWTPPLPADILDHYSVERQINLGKFSEIASTTQLTFTDTDFWLGSTFTYRIRAVDIYNRSSNPSNTMSVFQEVPTFSPFGIVVLLILVGFLVAGRARPDLRTTRN
jgi:hypothetical protein